MVIHSSCYNGCYRVATASTRFLQRLATIQAVATHGTQTKVVYAQQTITDALTSSCHVDWQKHLGMRQEQCKTTFKIVLVTGRNQKRAS